MNSLASRLRALLVAVCLLVVVACAAHGCHPQPTPGDVPASTPTTWVETAETVDGVLAWALPASDAVVSLLPIPADTKATVHRAFAVAVDARAAFHDGLMVYRARGGDACAVHAAAGALTVSLVGVARALGDVGWGTAPEVERVLVALGGLVDELAQRCDLDAGFSSSGASTRSQLTAIRLGASARGMSLRPFPDIAPPDGGAR